MGIKQKIKKEDLPKEFQNFELIETKDGVSDTVYLLGDKYVLKIYENWCDEVSILSLISNLCVPKVIKEFKIDSNYAIIFSQIKGKSSHKHSLEVVKFLKKLHETTKGKKCKNMQIFTKDILHQMIQKSKNKNFMKIFNSLDLELKNDGIIHGDLFPDNAKFIGHRLSGVYDFSEACVGDFYFDLAVVTFSFECDENEVLKEYGATISKKEFLEYIKFAKLYYTVSRYLAGRDWKELYEKI